MRYMQTEVNLFHTECELEASRLPGQCGYFKWPVASYFTQWINIKKAFARVTGVYPKGMMPMLEHLGIQHEGRHHSGIDDCKNIAKILKALAEKRFRFQPTGANR